ncbi:MAG: sulfatase [Acidobacteria bacterium]|nr:sulfatase [Acidobacteriota bacterium]
MNRRAFLKTVAGSLAASASLHGGQRPNVLFVSVDDMNDWVGCLGYQGVRTPNIDRLARRGVLFSNAHCAAPLCNPSRTALLTGMRPSTTGVYNNEQWWRPALPGAVTLPMHFKQNGYHVAGAGKVFHHVAGFNPPDQWHEFQLQIFDDPWYRRVEWYPWVKKIPAPPGHPFNGLENFPGEFDWGVLDKPEAEYGDAKAVDWASGFLERRHKQPFFLAVGLWHPHIPMFAPKSYFDLYPEVRMPVAPEDDLNDIPRVGQELAAFRREEHRRIVAEGKWKEAVRAYLASISFADALLGRMLAALDRSAYARNTIVVFWSDNGWHLGEKQHWHKSTLWERSTHVPLIIAGPGIRAPGAPRRQTVSLLDVYPTLCELCGLPMRKELEGETLSPLLRDPKARHRPVISTHEPGNHAALTERWRYIRYHDGGEELYDRVNDPNEWKNLAADPQYESLKKELAQWMPKNNARPVPERTAYDFDFASHTWRRK